MKKIIPFFLFLALIPSVYAQETNRIPSGIGNAIGVAFGAVILFFLIDYFLNIEINEKFIQEAVLIFIGTIVSVSIVSGSLYGSPSAPLYQISCGNRICDNEDILTCPWDCGYICGDNICNSNPPFSEITACPQDCPINNTLLINELQTIHRPLVAGLETSNLNGSCTLGSVFNINGSDSVITAGHCFSMGDNVFQPYPHCIIGGNESCNLSQSTIIGNVTSRYYIGDYTGDLELITLINITSSTIDYLNNTIECIADSFAHAHSFAVYKIGITTGLTFANWTGEGLFESDACYGRNATADIDDCEFIDFGDSGSAIITLTRPRQLVGIVAGFNDGYLDANQTILNYTGAESSNLSVIRSIFPDIPVCSYFDVHEDPPHYPNPMFT